MAVDWDGLVIGPTVHIFGDQVLFRTGEVSYQVEGVFDEEYLELTPMGSGGPGMEAMEYGTVGNITTACPVLGVRLIQFPANCGPNQNDRLQILTGIHAGETFIVREVRRDGHGHAKLLLNEFNGIF